VAIVGDALNARVWGLFAKAGFQTKPSEQDPEEAVVVLPGGTRRPVDLLASVPELGVSIIGQNTGASSLGQSVSSYFHDLAGLVATQRADAGLAVLTAITTSSTDLAFARERRIEVWGLESLPTTRPWQTRSGHMLSTRSYIHLAFEPKNSGKLGESFASDYDSRTNLHRLTCLCLR